MFEGHLQTIGPLEGMCVNIYPYISTYTGNIKGICQFKSYNDALNWKVLKNICFISNFLHVALKDIAVIIA